MAKELRILIYQDAELYVGQCLEHDLCVQGANLEEVRRRMERQANYYIESHGTLDVVDAAPAEFHEMWDKTEGEPKRVVMHVNDTDEDAYVKIAQAA